MKKIDSTTDDFDSINKDVFFGKCDFIKNLIDFFTSFPRTSFLENAILSKIG